MDFVTTSVSASLVNRSVSEADDTPKTQGYGFGRTVSNILGAIRKVLSSLYHTLFPTKVSERDCKIIEVQDQQIKGLLTELAEKELKIQDLTHQLKQDHQLHAEITIQHKDVLASQKLRFSQAQTAVQELKYKLECNQKDLTVTRKQLEENRRFLVNQKKFDASIIASLQEKIITLTQELEEVRKELESPQGPFEKTILLNLKEIANLEGKLKQAYAEFDKMNAEFLECWEDWSRLKMENEQLHDELENYTHIFDDLRVMTENIYVPPKNTLDERHPKLKKHLPMRQNSKSGLFEDDNIFN